MLVILKRLRASEASCRSQTKDKRWEPALVRQRPPGLGLLQSTRIDRGPYELHRKAHCVCILRIFMAILGFMLNAEDLEVKMQFKAYTRLYRGSSESYSPISLIVELIHRPYESTSHTLPTFRQSMFASLALHMRAT